MSIEMTEDEQIQQYREFTSMILSCQLAAEFNKSKPNKAIKHTLKCVRERVTSENVKIVCTNGIKSVYALGWLARQLNGVGRVGNMSREEFLEIGSKI